jgi:Protein of unknown function (DUF2800)
MQEEGSLGHKLWETGERPPGFEDLNALIDKLNDNFEVVLYDFERAYGCGEIQREVRLDYPGLNFGTMDRLVISECETAALIYDGKFGRWGVDHAENNLQGHNYGLYVWHHYPTVETLWIGFGNPRREEYTLAKFKRGAKEIWSREINMIVRNAQNPNPAHFRFDPVNCGFCARIDCPTRIDKAQAVLLQHNQTKPKDMTTEELTELRKLSNSLKTFVGVVNKESSKRVLEDGEEMAGYEVAEKVRRRYIKGKDNVIRALSIINNEFGALDASQDVELSFSSVEDRILEFYGSKKKAQPCINAVREALESEDLLTTETYHCLSAKP